MSIHVYLVGCKVEMSGGEFKSVEKCGFCFERSCERRRRKTDVYGGKRGRN